MIDSILEKTQDAVYNIQTRGKSPPPESHTRQNKISKSYNKSSVKTPCQPLKGQQEPKSETLLFLKTLASTAMPIKPATVKKNGRLNLVTIGQVNPTGLQCWSTMLSWGNQNNWNAFHLNPVKQMRKVQLKECINKAEVIPQCHQSICHKSLRMPGPEYESVQYLIEPGCRKIHIQGSQLPAEFLEHLQLESLLPQSVVDG